MSRYLLIVVACLWGGLSAFAGSKGDYRREVDSLRRELRFQNLRAKDDLRAAGPAPAAGAVTELEDGRVYFQADAGLVFEKLAPIRVNKLTLRNLGRLLVRLEPPSDIRPEMVRSVGEGGWGGAQPWDQGMPTGPARGRMLVAVLELDEFESVRQAVSSLVFLPGESPTEEELAACVARYPDHDEETSRLRCGLSP